MPKSRVTDKGLIQEAGSGLEFEQASSVANSVSLTISGSLHVTSSNLSRGVSPYQLDVFVITSQAYTVRHAGVYHLSGSSSLTPITATLPRPSSAPGSIFWFVSTSADPHMLTCSNAGSTVPQGTQAIVGPPWINTGSNDTATAFRQMKAQGSRLQLPSTISGSVGILCTGLSYLVIGASGSYIVDSA